MTLQGAIDPPAPADTVIGMTPRMIRPIALACTLCLLWTAGCGKSEDGPKAVDVAAQVTQLKGNTDAQATALSELAAAGGIKVLNVTQ